MSLCLIPTQVRLRLPSGHYAGLFEWLCLACYPTENPSGHICGLTGINGCPSYVLLTSRWPSCALLTWRSPGTLHICGAKGSCLVSCHPVGSLHAWWCFDGTILVKCSLICTLQTSWCLDGAHLTSNCLVSILHSDDQGGAQVLPVWLPTPWPLPSQYPPCLWTQKMSHLRT